MAAVTALYTNTTELRNLRNRTEADLIKWQNKEIVAEKQLGEQQKAEEKWFSSYEDAETKFNDYSQELKLNGNIVLSKSETKVSAGVRLKDRSFSVTNAQVFASQFASRKVPKYNPKLLEKAEDDDMDYQLHINEDQTILEMLDTMIEGNNERMGTATQEKLGVGN